MRIENAIPAPLNYLVRPLSRKNGFLRFFKLPAASFHAPPYAFPQKTWFLAIPSLGLFFSHGHPRGGADSARPLESSPKTSDFPDFWTFNGRPDHMSVSFGAHYGADVRHFGIS